MPVIGYKSSCVIPTRQTPSLPFVANVRSIYRSVGVSYLKFLIRLRVFSSICGFGIAGFFFFIALPFPCSSIQAVRSKSITAQFSQLERIIVTPSWVSSSSTIPSARFFHTPQRRILGQSHIKYFMLHLSFYVPLRILPRIVNKSL